MNPVFHFKHFSIHHDQSIMKVGTDGVLIGAYADVSNAANILDIGTGSGLIAIMLAQRCNARINGIEIDINSAEQARQNALQSPWADRVKIHHLSFQNYFPTVRSFFDCVVCNPPFFENQLRSPDANKNLVRHNVKLTFSELIHGGKEVLMPNGKFWIILPSDVTERFFEVAKKEGFSLVHQLEIFPKTGKKANRHIISLSLKDNFPVSHRSLTIRDKEGNFTDEYKKLTRDFYLDF
jgi:tRNA1Val (adenine37-N6)-methyltransferase